MFKKLLLIAIVSFIVNKVFAQNKDSLQPDSVYAKFKIKSRASYYPGSPSKSREIFLFDRTGRYSGFILTDNETGKKPQLKMIYTYDNKGILTSENDTSYRGDMFAIKNAEFYYFPNGTVSKKVIKRDGMVESEISYYPAENMETEKLYRNGVVYREQTSYYDTNNKKIRFSGTELGDKNAVARVVVVNGKQFTIPANNKDTQWDYKFENSYDIANRLVSQKRLVDGKLQDEEFYNYDDQGLITEKIEKSGNYKEQVIKFEYSYY
jgi:hypothetical protein